MQLSYFLAAAALAAAIPDGETKIQVHYNPDYDANRRIEPPRGDTVCRDEAPFAPLTWPYIGGYAPIKSNESQSCYNCYQLFNGVHTIWFQAIHTAKDGVELGSLLFDQLSGGNATELKHINVTIQRIDRLACVMAASGYLL